MVETYLFGYKYSQQKLECIGVNLIKNFLNYIEEHRDYGSHFWKNMVVLKDNLASSTLRQVIANAWKYNFNKYAIGNKSKRRNMIKSYKNMFRGKRCFIIASGPSTNKQDLSFLKNEITIGVNQSYLVTQRYKFHPTFMCCGDEALYPKIKEIYSNLNSKIVFSTGCLGNIGIDYVSKNLAMIIRLKPHLKVWHGFFSINLEKGVHPSRTVVIDLAIPLAVYLGCNEIYLLGCDTNSKGYAFSKDQEYLETNQKIYDEIFDSYTAVNKSISKKGIKLLNATLGGELNSIERVNFESIFDFGE